MREHQISFEELAAQGIPTPYDAMLSASPTVEIMATISKHYTKFNSLNQGEPEYANIFVSVSGGADSDRMIDLIERIGYPSGNVSYHYFNTGMEYRATIKHLNDLEKKYGIQIHKHYAKTPVPVACKQYGVPFLSKTTSENIYRLQKHDFKWEDKPFDALLKEYPHCRSALRWWCNEWGENSIRNISRNPWLKEFLIIHPPSFAISAKCCEKSKKQTAHDIRKSGNYDLDVQGVRKAEGGVRAISYSSCFDEDTFGCSKLRPLFWWKKSDCLAYDEAFGVEHSACYTKYGLDRTGCSCCPFGKHWERELYAAKQYEPGLYKVAVSTFRMSYEYMSEYHEFRKEKNHELYRNLSLPGGPGEDRQADPPDRRDRRCGGTARNGREDRRPV